MASLALHLQYCCLCLRDRTGRVTIQARLESSEREHCNLHEADVPEYIVSLVYDERYPKDPTSTFHPVRYRTRPYVSDRRIIDVQNCRTDGNTRTKKRNSDRKRYIICEFNNGRPSELKYEMQHGNYRDN